MGIAITNGIYLAVKMTLVGIIPLLGITSQLGGRTDGTGIIIFWLMVLAILQGIVIMHQAKVVAKDVHRTLAA